MNRKILAMAVGAAAVLSAVPAYGQEVRPIGLSLRAGLFWPTEDATRDNGGETWFAFGAEYKIRDLALATMDTGMNTSLTLSADYMGKGSFRHVPVLVNFVARNNQIYFTGGAGVGFTRVPTLSGSEDKTRFAYSLGAGYDFQQGTTPVFVELRFFGSSDSDLNGFGAFLGIRL